MMQAPNMSAPVAPVAEAPTMVMEPMPAPVMMQAPNMVNNIPGGQIPNQVAGMPTTPNNQVPVTGNDNWQL